RGVYKALLLNATAHGERGFVARGVSPDDCKTVYPGTSRDQYTHFIHGMWRYYNSGIATAAEKAKIAQIFSDIADKMEREVKPDAEPPYSFKFYKGMPDDRGVGKMLEVYPHEAARLSMFYAAAYSATKKRKYFDLYRKHIDYAIDHSAEISAIPERKLRWLVPAYAVLQMESSLELLHAVEKDAALKKRIAGVMDLVAEFFDKCPVYDIEKRKSSRDCAEIINGKLMSPSYKLSQTDEKILRSRIANLNGARDCGGAYTLLSAYWKARAKGYLKP
ncbi:MAG: hypothetical protein IJI37_05005, partial [Opitutales bacterium]|nr:hypothetical protein [Opitutales bacterium]